MEDLKDVQQCIVDYGKTEEVAAKTGGEKQATVE